MTELPQEVGRLTRRLRLPYVRAEAPEVLATARSQRWDPTEVLKVLLEAEAAGRDHATRTLRKRQANLPKGKTFDSWIESESSIPTPTQQALQTLEWIDRREALVICGPSGTGKSHYLEAIARHAIDRDKRVAWFTLETLEEKLRGARVDGSVAKTVAAICRCDLIAVDDIGMLKATEDQAQAFYRIIDAAYERRSIAITSNLHPSGFDALMPKTIATAAVDRLLHHAHVIVTEGSSHRLQEAKQGTGVVPLPR